MRYTIELHKYIFFGLLHLITIHSEEENTPFDKLFLAVQLNSGERNLILKINICIWIELMSELGDVEANN